MDKEKSLLRQVVDIKEDSKMVYMKGMGNLLGQMAIFTKESIRREKGTVLEH